MVRVLLSALPQSRDAEFQLESQAYLEERMVEKWSPWIQLYLKVDSPWSFPFIA